MPDFFSQKVIKSKFSVFRKKKDFWTHIMAHPWELTHQLSQYFDPHLIIPLLEFLTANGMYSETDLSKAKLELLKGTSMVDFYIEEHKKTYPDQAKICTKYRKHRKT